MDLTYAGKTNFKILVGLVLNFILEWLRCEGLYQAYKFDILKKTQEQENSKLKEKTQSSKTKTQGFHKMIKSKKNVNVSTPKLPFFL